MHKTITTPEYGWLAEIRDKNGKPFWLVLDKAAFTDDSIEATRFCRKKDCEAAIRHLGKIKGMVATDHQWGL